VRCSRRRTWTLLCSSLKSVSTRVSVAVTGVGVGGGGGAVRRLQPRVSKSAEDMHVALLFTDGSVDTFVSCRDWYRCRWRRWCYALQSAEDVDAALLCTDGSVDACLSCRAWCRCRCLDDRGVAVHRRQPRVLDVAHLHTQSFADNCASCCDWHRCWWRQWCCASTLAKSAAAGGRRGPCSACHRRLCRHMCQLP
jgi:hypothetical protein